MLNGLFRSSLLGLTLTLSLSAPQTIRLQNTDVKYQDQKGTANALAAHFILDDIAHDYTNALFDLTLQDEILSISNATDGFKYDLKASFMKDVTKADFGKINIDYDEKNVNLSVSSADLSQKDTDVSARDLSVFCNGAQTIIDSCINKMKVTLSSARIANKSTTTLNDLSVNIKSTSLDFSVRALGIGKINGNGNVTHQLDQKQITIKIDKVKFGILTITGKFFDAIEGTKSPNVKISRPYIYITYE